MGIVTPSAFGIFLSLNILTMVVVGGTEAVWGALFGAGLLTTLPEVLRSLLPALSPGALAEYEQVLVGVILVLALVMIFLPEGLVPWLVRRFRLREGRTAARVAALPSGTAGRCSVSPGGRSMGGEEARRAPDPGADVLSVSGFTKRFGGVTAVDGVSFRVAEGEIFALIGPNGAGKTTVLNVISGALSPSAGTIHYRGRDITGLPSHRIAALGLGRTFQDLAIWGEMTVLENVMAGRCLHGRTGLRGALLRSRDALREEEDDADAALVVLGMVGLAPLAQRRAGGLSFGQQRLLEIARVLASGADLLLLDEPAAGLTAAETAELASMCVELRRQGRTVVLVDHNMGLVMDVADRVAVLHAGRMLACGAPEVIRWDPAVVTAYLGGRREGPALAMAAVAEKNEVPQVALASSIKLVQPVKKWVFKSIYSDVWDVQAILEFLQSKGIRKIGFIHDSNAYGTSGKEQMARRVADYGASLVAMESYNSTDSDMTVQLTRIRDALAKIHDFVGVTGIYSMTPQDHEGLNRKDIIIAQYQNGKYVLVRE